jgi:dihydroflavonol-4-reductase
MKVLVTGANGLLGHHVVMQLLEREHDVKIVVRSLRSIYFDLNKVIITEGEFTNYETLKIAASDCDAIIHIAAVTATDLLHYEQYKEINVAGSEKIIRVADELNINRLVFISTANTLVTEQNKAFRMKSRRYNFLFQNRFTHEAKQKPNNFSLMLQKKPIDM